MLDDKTRQVGVRSILWVAVLTCLAMLSKEQVTVTNIVIIAIIIVIIVVIVIVIILVIVVIIIIMITTRASQCLLYVWYTKWSWHRSSDQETGSHLQRLPLLVRW